jgi:hypothetical protein
VSTQARVRLELDQRRAGALHAALSEALSGRLLAGDRHEAALELLDELDAGVPGWMAAAPVGGEAGYLIAAEAVLRALVDAEDRGRSALTEVELLGALGDAEPLGTSAGDVLTRMRRERLIRVRHGEHERWWSAAPDGRRLLLRDTAARDDVWAVQDADALLDLVYAEHRPGARAHRPSVQAIGRLDATRLDELVRQLGERELMAPAPSDGRWIELAWDGVELARERWRGSATGLRYSWDGPPAPPYPYQRRLPPHINREDRQHPDLWPDEAASRYCPPTAWLHRSSKTRLWDTLRRDGAAQWSCRHCDTHWLVYLQAHGRDGLPAYRDPAAATHNRPCWRPTHKP